MSPMLAHAVDGVLKRLLGVYGREFVTKYDVLEHDAGIFRDFRAQRGGGLNSKH